MTFTPKVWKDNDLSTALSAAGLIDLETRLAAYIDSRVAAALQNTGPGTLTNTSSSHALQILNQTTNDSSCEALDIVSSNELDTTFGLKGVEQGKGTIKATHQKPPSGASDVNASALSLRCNGSGTAAQGIFFDAEQTGGTTGKLMNFRQNGVERFVVGNDGDLITGGNNLNDFHLARRASNCYTMPDLLAQTSLTLASGLMYGVVAFALKAATFTKIRFATSATTPAGLTDVRLAVWDSSGNLLGSTANINTTVTSTNTMYEISLLSSVTLTENQRVYLGLAWTGTTLAVRGAGSISTLTGTRTGRTFELVRVPSGYAGGTPGTLTPGGSGIIPWLELL